MVAENEPGCAYAAGVSEKFISDTRAIGVPLPVELSVQVIAFIQGAVPVTGCDALVSAAMSATRFCTMVRRLSHAVTVYVGDVYVSAVVVSVNVSETVCPAVGAMPEERLNPNAPPFAATVTTDVCFPPPSIHTPLGLTALVGTAGPTRIGPVITGVRLPGKKTHAPFGKLETVQAAVKAA